MATIDTTAGVFAPREAEGDLQVAVTQARGHAEVIADGELDPAAAWRLRAGWDGAQVVIRPPECLLAKMLRQSGVPIRRQFDPE